MIELLFFSGKTCSVCQSLKPKVLHDVRENFPDIPIRIIDVEEEMEVAGQHMVFTLPVVIIKFEGKEVFRFARSFAVYQVLEKIKRLNDV